VGAQQHGHQLQARDRPRHARAQGKAMVSHVGRSVAICFLRELLRQHLNRAWLTRRNTRLK
jgi:hypothetical protein